MLANSEGQTKREMFYLKSLLKLEKKTLVTVREEHSGTCLTAIWLFVCVYVYAYAQASPPTTDHDNMDYS